MPRRIDQAEFVTSAVAPRDFPTTGEPEVAMVGRSNVGKSSMINALVRKAIARTSAAPGKTRLVNIYRILCGADRFFLVDLPGYGHASGGEKAQREFAALTGSYFESRVHQGAGRLAGAILVIDARHPGLASDVDGLRWLHSLGTPSIVVAAKVDKLSQAEKAKLRRECETAFGQAPIAMSSTTGEGLDEVWQQIRAWTV